MDISEQLDEQAADFREFNTQPETKRNEKPLPPLPVKQPRRAVSPATAVIASIITIIVVVATLLFLQNRKTPPPSNLPPHQNYPANLSSR